VFRTGAVTANTAGTVLITTAHLGPCCGGERSVVAAAAARAGPAVTGVQRRAEARAARRPPPPLTGPPAPGRSGAAAPGLAEMRSRGQSTPPCPPAGRRYASHGDPLGLSPSRSPSHCLAPSQWPSPCQWNHARLAVSRVTVRVRRAPQVRRRPAGRRGRAWPPRPAPGPHSAGRSAAGAAARRRRAPCSACKAGSAAVRVTVRRGRPASHWRHDSAQRSPWLGRTASTVTVTEPRDSGCLLPPAQCPPGRAAAGPRAGPAEPESLAAWHRDRDGHESGGSHESPLARSPPAGPESRQNGSLDWGLQTLSIGTCRQEG
jgi:hypothetical protein